VSLTEDDFTASAIDIVLVTADTGVVPGPQPPEPGPWPPDPGPWPPEPGPEPPSPWPGPQPGPGCDEPIGEISGTVWMDDARTSVASDAHVVALQIPSANALPSMPSTSESDEDGRYVITDLCPGAYLVVAMLIDGSDILAGFHEAAPADGMPDEVELTEDNPTATEVDIVLERIQIGLPPELGPPAGAGATAPGLSAGRPAPVRLVPANDYP